MEKEDKTETRKLAAILFADIQGYTALMQDDEDSARKILSQFRSTLDNYVPKYHGRVVKYFGDGCLCLFNSSVEAVNCSILIQKYFQEAKVPVRIGIHSGEVFFESNDVFGNSVNIASRIESMGTKGSILISNRVNKEIRNHTGFKTESLGRYRFKNVSEDMEIFALSNEGFPIPNAEEVAGKFRKIKDKKGIGTSVWLSILALAIVALVFYMQSGKEGSDSIELSSVETINKRSLVVLPFTLISNTTDQEYLSDGMMDEILNRLFQINGLKVSSRTSSMKYKESKMTTQEIADDLRVANVLEGSIRPSKDEIQVTIRMINALNDSLKWMEIYNRPLDDIFELQSDIAKEIASKLSIQIDREVESRFDQYYTEDIEAWKLFRMARLAADNDDNETAEKFLLEAIDLDPNFAPPYAELGFLTLLGGSYLGNASPDEFLNKGEAYLEKALELNPNFPRTRIYLALIHLWFNWDFVRADEEWNAFHKLGPSNPKDAGYVEFLIASGRFKEAVEISETLLKENPQEMSSWTTTGLSFYFDGNKEKAVDHYQKALQLFNSQSVTIEAARTFLFAKEYDLVIQTLEPGFKSLEDASSRRIGMLAIAYFKTERNDEALELLRILMERADKTAAGSPSYYAAGLLAQMNQTDEAFVYLQRAYDAKEVEMYWLNIEEPFQPLKSDPRWIKIIQAIGFPSYVKN